MGGKKDYTYRGTWEHQLSRARNLAQRGGLTKPEMLAKYGRFPKSNEWWGPEKDRHEWEKAWKQAHPKPSLNVASSPTTARKGTIVVLPHDVATLPN